MCIITAHAIFISPTIKYNIMNTDSKLNRHIILLQKAPFILFIESPGYDIVYPKLNKLGVIEGDFFKTIEIKENTDLRVVIAATNGLPDPLAYNIIEALANSLPNNDLYLQHFPVHFFTKSDWQDYIEWQNVDNKPEPADYFTIVVSKFTHELSIIDDVNIVLDGEFYDGVIHLESLDINVPFPLALLKECTMEIHDIIVQMSVGRVTVDKTKSKYLSVMHTGHETFNYISLRQIEKDLRAVLTAFNITIEE